MVLLNSDNKNLSSLAPNFTLPSVQGEIVSLNQFKTSPAIVIMFICNHCPYVQAVEDRYIELAKYCANLSVGIIGICSNDPTDYPDDSKEALLKRWVDKKYGFPYLIDEDQAVAKNYGVVCTPEFFILDKERKIAYHGQLDDNWKEASKVRSEDLKLALDEIVRGETPSNPQRPSIGCSVKWKKSSSNE